MRLLFVSIMLCAWAAGLHAESIGVTVNGACVAGNCSPTPLAFNSSDTLPFDYTLTLANGDSYLVFGSFSAGNNYNGAGFSADHVFEVMYAGNPTGGPSADDIVDVTAYSAYQTSTPSVSVYRDVFGAFGSTISGSSTAASCLIGNAVSCVGVLKPPGIFNQATDYFVLDASDGTYSWDPYFTNNFGAGSPVGSYIVWGQTTPLIPPTTTPEPESIALFAVGLCAIGVMGKRMHICGR